jgi:chromatin remodeling complex protein RSC6
MSSAASSDNSIKMSTAAKTTKAAASKSAAKAVEPVAAAVAPVAAAAPAPKATKATKATKAAETVAAPVVAPVAAPAPSVAAPVATETTATETVADETVTTLNKSVARLAEINAQQKSLAVEAATLTKAIEKLTARLAKKAEKRSRKGKGNGGKAFTIPLQITHELEAFLGLPKDTKVCRKDVNAGVYAYAKSHGLMKGKNIFPDAALRKILGVDESTEVTILNIMKFLNHHYIKPAAPAAN